MKFYSKKDLQQLIAILSKYWNKAHGVFLFLHKMNSTKFFLKQLEYDSCLVINRLDKFYLYYLHILTTIKKSESEVIALDPGVHTFMTSYDPSRRLLNRKKQYQSDLSTLSYIYCASD
ncbi:recf/recn/smc domain containing protein [Gigaspora margarita]|uniref:Recf/recn/smc domain containing protein n=1 Tax=Gigaspora margarita TaxID=4874 RepID=A0A8H3XEQ0_GIGMA|nr:recf/recn/smc domain containing protein [Gigaspora margarita]